jgi:hypothetical protein
MMHLRPMIVPDDEDPTMLGFEEFLGVALAPDEVPPSPPAPQPVQPHRGRLLPGEEGDDQAPGNARNRPRERTHPRGQAFPGIEDVLDQDVAGPDFGYSIVESTIGFSINTTAPLPHPEDFRGGGNDGSDSDVWEPAYPPTGSTLEADDLAADLGPAADDVEVAAMNSRRLRGQMYDMGYRDGAAAGRDEQAQPGCDAGYQFGATLGRVTGWIIGLLSVLAALAGAVADQTYRELRGIDDDEDLEAESDDSDDAGGVMLTDFQSEHPPLRARHDRNPYGLGSDPGPSLYVETEIPDMAPINAQRATMTGVAPRDDYSDEELGFGPAPAPARPRSTGAGATGGLMLDEDVLARAEALAAIRTRRSDLGRGCTPNADGSPTNCANARYFDGVVPAAVEAAEGGEEDDGMPSAETLRAELLRAERLRQLLAAAREDLSRERLWEPRLMELARETPEEQQQQLWDDVATLHPVVAHWRGEAERAMREFALDLDEGADVEEGGDEDDGEEGEQLISEFDWSY